MHDLAMNNEQYLYVVTCNVKHTHLGLMTVQLGFVFQNKANSE